MKFFLGFITGLICGAIATFLLLMLMSQTTESAKDQGLTLFAEPGACVTRNPLKVFQTLDSNRALVLEEKTLYKDITVPGDTVMLLIGTETEHFYDNQVIKIPAKQCAKQVGVYEYWNKEKFHKTVPAVNIQ